MSENKDGVVTGWRKLDLPNDPQVTTKKEIVTKKWKVYGTEDLTIANFKRVRPYLNDSEERAERREEEVVGWFDLADETEKPVRGMGIAMSHTGRERNTFNVS